MWLCKLKGAGSGEPTGSCGIREREGRGRENSPTVAAPSVMKPLLKLLPRPVSVSGRRTIEPCGTPVFWL